MAKEKRHYATEAEIADIMAKNGWSRDDAEFYLIDKYDEVVFPDETDEVIDEHKQNLKIANVYDNKKGKRKVTRKPDEDKRELIEVIAKALEEYAPEVKNVEREVTFNYKGANYSVTLTKHRG
jgi:phage terminase large subunit-like protein